MTNITFDRSLGETLMGRLLEAYYRNFGVHNFKPETHAPQHLSIPEGMKRGGKAWRRWLAPAAGSDYRTQSMRHYEQHVNLHKTHRWLYTPKAANGMPALIEQLLQEKGFSKWKAMASHIPVLAGTLARLFDDDPLQLYLRYSSIDALMRFKEEFKREYKYDGIPGFGPKTSSLYALFLEEEGLVQIEDALPVDVWVQ